TLRHKSEHLFPYTRLFRTRKTMRIYTRSGDKGTTGLVYGSRVAKDDLRVEAYGTCDEANSMIGLALSHLNDVAWEGKQDFLNKMYRVQTILFHVGAEL